MVGDASSEPTIPDYCRAPRGNGYIRRLHRTFAFARAVRAWLALLRRRPLQLAHCAGRCCLASISLHMILISINTTIPTVHGRFAACVKSRAADTFANNPVARSGLALQVPHALWSTAGAADAAHDTHKHHLHCNSSGTGGRGEPLALGISRFPVAIEY